MTDYVKVAVQRVENDPVEIMTFMIVINMRNEDGSEYVISRDPTPENIEAEIISTNPIFLRWSIVDEADIPDDREYRIAWKLVGNKIQVDPVLKRSIDLEIVRTERNRLLEESDMKVLPDLYSEMTEEEQYKWNNYRKILRDIPELFPNPEDVVWPVAPDAGDPTITQSPPSAASDRLVFWNPSIPGWDERDKTDEEIDAERIDFWNKNHLNRIQFEFMVEKLNLNAVIDGAIAAMPSSTEDEVNAKIMARVLFKSGQDFYRLHPLFVQLAPIIGLTDQQLDEIWMNARQL